VLAEMVSLTKKSFPLYRISDCFIFQCPSLVINGRLYDSPAIGLQDTVDLATGFDIIIHMFQDMVAKHDIKGIVFKRNLVDVHFHLRQRRFYVARNIVEVVQSLKPVDKAKLGRYM